MYFGLISLTDEMQLDFLDWQVISSTLLFSYCQPFSFHYSFYRKKHLNRKQSVYEETIWIIFQGKQNKRTSQDWPSCKIIQHFVDGQLKRVDIYECFYDIEIYLLKIPKYLWIKVKEKKTCIRAVRNCPPQIYKWVV